MTKKNDHWHYRPHPRSALKSLEEPFLDPRDGRGAYSSDHIMQLREYQAAMRGEPKALVSSLKRAMRRSKRMLKQAKGQKQRAWQEAREDWPSPLPVMEMLGMVQVKRWHNKDGTYYHLSRQVTLADWLEEVVRTHPKSSARAREALERWHARDCVDLRKRSEEALMD